MQFTCTTIRLRLSAVGSAADSLLANMIVFVWQRLYLTVQQRLHAVISQVLYMAVQPKLNATSQQTTVTHFDWTHGIEC